MLLAAWQFAALHELSRPLRRDLPEGLDPGLRETAGPASIAHLAFQSVEMRSQSAQFAEVPHLGWHHQAVLQPIEVPLSCRIWSGFARLCRARPLPPVRTPPNTRSR